MYLKHWILLATLLTVAYAAIEPLNLQSVEPQDLQAEESQEHPEHVREKRFLLKKALFAKKALVIGGAVGLGVGLAKSKR